MHYNKLYTLKLKGVMDMIKNRLIESFKEIGFDEYNEIKTEDIIFSQDVFNECAKNTCGNYGKNYSCMGHSVDESKSRIEKYENAFLISKIVSIRTGEEMMDSLALIEKSNKALRDAFDNEHVFVMGAGPCTKCKACSALEGEPCRFPDKIQYSMEGSGIDVVRMSINEKMTYNAGGGRIGYFTLVLY